MNLLIIDMETQGEYSTETLAINPSGASESYLNNIAVNIAKDHKVFFIQRNRKIIARIFNLYV